MILPSVMSLDPSSYYSSLCSLHSHWLPCCFLDTKYAPASGPLTHIYFFFAQNAELYMYFKVHLSRSVIEINFQIYMFSLFPQVGI